MGRRARRRIHAAVPTKAPGWVRRRRIEATRGGKTVGTAVTHFRAAPGDAEYFDATMHAGTLRRIADETGGRFYEADEHGDARRRSALHRPRRDHGRRARSVAHADRADAAGRAAVRGMGVSACRRAGVRLRRRGSARDRVGVGPGPGRGRGPEPMARMVRRRRVADVATIGARIRRQVRSCAFATARTVGHGDGRGASRPGRTTSRAPISTS